jgi:exopolysaccharide biosynthesis polyprenyl glycosylphosphotransferase
MRSNRRFEKAPLIVLAGDVVLIPLSFIGGYALRFGHAAGFWEMVPPLLLAVMTLCYLLFFYFLDLYELRKKPIGPGFLVEILFGTLFAGIFASFLKYGLSLFPVGRGIFILSNGLIVVASFLWRWGCSRSLKILAKPKRVVVVGREESVHKAASVFSAAGEAISLTSHWNPDAPEWLLRRIDEIKPDLLVVTPEAEKDARQIPVLLESRLRGVQVMNFVELYQSLHGRIPVEYVSETWFLDSETLGFSEKTALMRAKRMIDVLLSTLLLILTLPFWPIIAAMIKINSRGPVFYRQARVGLNEETFSLYKFRSMFHKAEKNGAVWAGTNDWRITFVGRMLRVLHADELPQLLNVLKGDMSLVGPRPERPEFIGELKSRIPFYALRHVMKPGLTGWAQVNFPYASSLETSREKLEYDLFYISRANLLLDVKILARTAKAVLLGKRPLKA